MKMEKVYRLLVLVTIAMIAKSACGATIKDVADRPDAPQSEGQMYFDQVPLEKRDAFIRYFLGEGLRQQAGYIGRSPRLSFDAEKEFGAPPQGFATNLLVWAKATFELEDVHVQTLVEEAYVCIPSKGCYDPNDIGGHCCPL